MDSPWSRKESDMTEWLSLSNKVKQTIIKFISLSLNMNGFGHFCWWEFQTFNFLNYELPNSFESILCKLLLSSLFLPLITFILHLLCLSTHNSHIFPVHFSAHDSQGSRHFFFFLQKPKFANPWEGKGEKTIPFGSWPKMQTEAVSLSRWHFSSSTHGAF